MILTHQQKRLILKPASRLDSLLGLIQKIAKNCTSNIEFRRKIENKLRSILQYEIHQLEYVQKELKINNTEFDLLQKVGNEILNNLNQCQKDIHYGILKTQKNVLNFNFKYRYFLDYIEEYKGEVYVFDIWSEGKEAEKKFSFQLKKMKNGKDLKVVDLYPGKDEYKGKGISIAIINESKMIFNKRIISSSNNYKKTCHNGESNSDIAIIKVWQRMLDQGMVKYDIKNDFYFTI